MTTNLIFIVEYPGQACRVDVVELLEQSRYIVTFESWPKALAALFSVGIISHAVIENLRYELMQNSTSRLNQIEIRPQQLCAAGFLAVSTQPLV